ncbi:head GIN domain-containing protein [Saccharospirillum alexandrii]|uniref:head GIN domain-containing protein n=1 Tax=Saccharospirillum alexandrii TaxID=2448477 RepID=UPI000FD7F137|nr:head GIN domain-containing protein [Saccharospirillum alexandrii]
MLVRNSRWTLWAAFVTFALAGCAYNSTVRGEGEVVVTEIALGEVLHVDIGGRANVTLHQSERNELVVHAQQNVLDELYINLTGDRLEVRPRRGVTISSRSPLSYDLYLSRLERLDLSGSSQLVSDGFETPRLRLDIAGSADIDMVLTVDELDLDTAGSVDARLAGRADRFSIDASGSADIDAQALVARDVDIDTAGSASVRVWAEDALRVDAAGAASIRYRGRPVIHQDLAGSASVNPL